MDRSTAAAAFQRNEAVARALMNAPQEPAPATLTAYEPSWRDDAAAWLINDLGANKTDVGNIMGSRGAGTSGTGLVDFTPVGAGFALNEGQRALSEGDWLLGGLNLAGALPAGKLAMFAGLAARTADREAYSVAKRMAENGAPREAIWNETGWFKGTDDKWRFEIPDQSSSYYGNAVPGYAEDVLPHSQLYEAYPDLADIEVGQLTGGNLRGTYLPGEIGLNRNMPPSQGRSSMLHEMQHGVQEREEFARGGNTASMFHSSNPEIRKATVAEWKRLMAPDDYETFATKMRSIDPNVEESIIREQYEVMRETSKRAQNNVYDPINLAAQETAAQNVYRRLAGEVEARNVQTRMNMYPDERRETPPWLTQDVPDTEQIVRMGGF